MTRAADPKIEQQSITARYDRAARFYDLYDKPMDLLGVRKRRRRLLEMATGRTLEVGVGTGRNLPFYPPSVDLVGIDISPNMLKRARQAAEKHDQDVALEIGDVQNLPFADDEFDTVVATAVFCSVADPVAGLTEVARVVRPDGRVLLLEHVRPRNAVLGWIADRVNPAVRRLLGPNINRDTEHNIARAGITIDQIERWGVWRTITARHDHPLPQRRSPTFNR